MTYLFFLPQRNIGADLFEANVEAEKNRARADKYYALYTDISRELNDINKKFESASGLQSIREHQEFINLMKKIDDRDKTIENLQAQLTDSETKSKEYEDEIAHLRHANIYLKY